MPLHGAQDLWRWLAMAMMMGDQVKKRGYPQDIIVFVISQVSQQLGTITNGAKTGKLLALF